MLRNRLLIRACLACFAIRLLGAFFCLMGLEAIATGLNPVPWLLTFGLLVALPRIGGDLSIWALRRNMRR